MSKTLITFILLLFNIVFFSFITFLKLYIFVDGWTIQTIYQSIHQIVQRWNNWKINEKKSGKKCETHGNTVEIYQSSVGNDSQVSINKTVLHVEHFFRSAFEGFAEVMEFVFGVLGVLSGSSIGCIAEALLYKGAVKLGVLWKVKVKKM